MSAYLGSLLRIGKPMLALMGSAISLRRKLWLHQLPTVTAYRLGDDGDGRNECCREEVGEITDLSNICGAVGKKPPIATDSPDTNP